MSSQNTAPTSDLVKQTLRTVIVLVTACVVFVGALSGAAVAITSRAFSSPSGGSSESSAAKPSAASSPLRGDDNAPAAKKPQSI